MFPRPDPWNIFWWWSLKLFVEAPVKGGPSRCLSYLDHLQNGTQETLTGADLGGGCRGVHPPPPEMTCGFLIQLLVFKSSLQSVTPFLSGARPPKKNPGSAPAVKVVVYQDRKPPKR